MKSWEESDMNLELQPTITSGDGPSLTNDRVIQYRVLGLPPGHDALIWKPEHSNWKTTLIFCGNQSEWKGNYKTKESAALATI